ncbi:MAG: hypothetical protein GQ533_03305 [Methanosarcinaceae archaeon]|nr:hypothetical protein [Methanosarcinaceae archaeon]
MTIDSTVYLIENMMSNMILAVIAIFAGLVLGNILGNKVSKIVEKLGLDKTFKGSVIEKGVEAAGTTIPGLFNLVIRWFIYLIAVMIALDYLNIPQVNNFINNFVNYLPSVFAAMLILFVGLVIADFLGNFLKNTGKSMGLPFIDIITPVLKLLLYFIVVIMALSKLHVDMCIIYILSEAFVWGIGLGIGLSIAIIVGFGMKDRSPELMDKLLEGFDKAKK